MSNPLAKVGGRCRGWQAWVSPARGHPDGLKKAEGHINPEWYLPGAPLTCGRMGRRLTVDEGTVITEETICQCLATRHALGVHRECSCLGWQARLQRPVCSPDGDGGAHRYLRATGVLAGTASPVSAVLAGSPGVMSGI